MVMMIKEKYKITKARTKTSSIWYISYSAFQLVIPQALFLLKWEWVFRFLNAWNFLLHESVFVDEER